MAPRRTAAVNHNQAMQTRTPSVWWLRIATLVLAALASASAGYWVLKWLSATAPLPAPVTAAAALAAPQPQAIARLLGANPAAASAGPAPAADQNGGRLKLMGVVAGRSNRGYALIAVDGKPARPFGVGSQVTDGLVLQSVAARSAELAPTRDAPAALILELPKPALP